MCAYMLMNESNNSKEGIIMQENQILEENGIIKWDKSQLKKLYEMNKTKVEEMESKGHERHKKIDPVARRLIRIYY